MIIATFACSSFLPMQLLFSGKTSRCHPNFELTPEFDVWHSPNHWANKEATIRFTSHVILPYMYINKVQQKMKLLSDYPALVTFDVFRGQSV